MRFVDRNRIPKPEFLDSRKFDEVRHVLAEIHDTASGGKRMKQRIVSFDEMFEPFRDKAIEALRKVFHDKCAYTENPSMPEEPLTFHLHRPGADARGIRGSIHPEHYWWLQTEWSNWMLVSQQIGSIKGTNFPVWGDRMEMGADTFDVGLLIDPCEEEPSWWLEFDEKGWVTPRQIEDEVTYPFGSVVRGEVNIRQLDLNNEQLIDGRRNAIRKSQLKQILLLPSEDIERRLDNIFDPSTPYLGAIRQHGARVLCDNIIRLLKISKERPSFPEAAINRLSPEIAAYLCSNLNQSQKLRKNIGSKKFDSLFGAALKVALEKCPGMAGRLVGIKRTTARFRIDKAQHDIKADGLLQIEPHTKMAATQENTIGRSALLKTIVIRNFKAIENLKIEIPEKTEDISTGPLYDRKIRTSAVNWKMLLGENASGKSCILQAIALALCGPAIEKDPPVNVEEARRRGIGNRASFVQLSFRGYDDRPVKLKINKSGFKYEWKPDYHTFVRAYGATRLFQSNEDKWDENRPSERIRVGNLFDPKFPVIDVNNWLMSLDEGDFNVAARAIHELIAGVGDNPTGVQNHVMLRRDRDNNKVMLGDGTLEELSDGYRALLAMICDIMAGLGAGLSDMENALGIVLIDEIGAHLHPRLRMQVVPRMRYIFPRIQFIASTHEPLCLRGLFENEVDRVRRINGVVSRETISRSPSSYRVDQLLTSEFFGLETTIDPEIDDQFQHYYHLLRKIDLSNEEIEKREQLRTRLITEGVLGYTRRDQLVYEAIDEYLADKRMKSATPGKRGASQLKTETIERVKRYWGMAELKHIGGES